MSNNISVLGSINLDTTDHIARIPLPGETIQVNKKSSAAGGKGANQAVAARRSGAEVYFIGAVGDDSAGQSMIDTLRKETIDLTNVEVKKDERTGAATILLDDNGQNSILVYAGANNLIDEAQVKKAESTIAKSDFIISQFETPVSATLETESAVITGIDVVDQNSMEKTAEFFKNKGVTTTLITLGSRGVYCSTKNDNKLIPAHKVKTVDTTGAGDTFIGSMVSVLKKDLSNILEAIDYGQKASSITVQGLGAQPSIPTREKIKEVYEEV